MATEILMPKLGLTMKNGTITRWLVNVGDAVKEKDPILEIETEKLTNTVEAPADGVLIKRLGEVGDKFDVSAVVGYIGQPGESVGDAPAEEAAPEAAEKSAPDAKKSASAKNEGGRIFISPLARKLAEQRGIDYTKIKGSGPNGRIVKADIEAYVPEAEKAPAPSMAAAVTEAVLPETVLEAGDTVVPYSGMRRAIGEKMHRAAMEIPMVTHHVSADASALVRFRTSLNAGAADKSEKVSVNDIIMKITAAALEKMPIMNSSLTAGGIVLHKRVNLGMATAIDGGLLVPVVHDANMKGLLRISRECKELAAKARSGGLVPENMQGGTFTVTNLGGYGSVDSFTPIINLPEAAILGVGRMVDTVVPGADGFEVRPMISFSLTYDHRILDGAAAAEFMKIFLELFAKPERACLS